MKVALIGKNQMFGHEDVLNNRNCTTTVKCISNSASIYYCKAEEFYNIINRDEKSWKILANICLQKDTNLIKNIKRAAKSTFKHSSDACNIDIFNNKGNKSPSAES